MNELTQYLVKEYPKNGKLWHLLRVSFLNDYHRRCRDELIVALNPFNGQLTRQIIGSKLIGMAILNTYDWLRQIDPDLYKLLLTKESRIFMLGYFEVDNLEASADKLSDLVHGDGYCERVKESVWRALLT